MKSHDKWCVPLSAEMHFKQHNIGEKSFWGDMQLVMNLAAKLYEIFNNYGAQRGREKAIHEIIRWNRVFRSKK